MLVLVRKRDESIIIGGDIVVTVLGVEGERVKIGIKAPREVSILRQELCEQVMSENRAAVASSAKTQRLLPELKGRLADARVVAPI